MNPALFFTALLLTPLVALHAAELKLASVLADHMVLQRDKPIAVWGWADPGESVAVSFAGQSKSAIAAADGKWSLKLDALTASAEPRTLTATGKDGRKVEVKDVLVGEVWLGSGQSNMEMSVKASNHFDAEQAAANLPLIRYYSDTRSLFCHALLLRSRDSSRNRGARGPHQLLSRSHADRILDPRRSSVQRPGNEGQLRHLHERLHLF
jgi:hypothetical protein